MPAIRSTLAALLLGVSLVAAHAAGPVAVRFVEPQRFFDAGDPGIDRERNLRVIEDALAALGQRWLPAGQSLDIDVLDVDLAGRIKPNVGRTGQELRVLEGGADWPRIELRYTLRTGTQVLASGRETVSDMHYLDSGARLPDSGPLAHERRMLEAWFRGRFAAGSDARVAP